MDDRSDINPKELGETPTPFLGLGTTGVGASVVPRGTTWLQHRFQDLCSKKANLKTEIAKPDLPERK